MMIPTRRGVAARVTARRAGRTRPAAAAESGGTGVEPLERRTLLAFTVTPAVETDPVPHSGDAADDAAIWVHPTDVSQSTVIASDKDGGLAVYDLSGDELQYVSLGGSVNNVDLRHGFPLGGQAVDLVVGSHRSANVLAVYRVNPATRLLENVAARSLRSNLAEIYGLAMYHSPTTGKFYAYTSDRRDGRVEQWELFDNGAGRVDGRIVRTFDAGGTVEGMVADDETGALYAGEETGGLWKYGAEPTAGTARTLLDTTNSGGRLTADLEGLAIYYAAGGAGYLLASNQGANEFMIYNRQTGAFIDRFTVSSGGIDGVNDTDGIDVTSFGLGPLFPEGLFVVQDGSNSGGNQNFKLVRWGDIARAASPDLLIDPLQDPRVRGGGPGVTVPTGPSNLSATALSATRVDLTWNDNSDNESAFRLERSTDGTTWTSLATVGANVTSYSDTTAPPGTAISYRVSAANAAGVSTSSNVATAVTPQEQPTAAVTFVSAGSTWKYLDNGSDQGTAWRATGFDDTTWNSGPAQLGYGDGDEATAINSGGTSRFITSYLRRAFDVADPAAVTELTLRLLRDDGAVVYLNGTEVARSNMPAGPVTYTTGASTFLGAPEENAWHTFSVSPASLVAGRNVLAVEVHQYDSVSTDLSFDLQLDGRRTGAVEEQTPPASPSGLIATGVAPDAVVLTWSDNSNSESGFRIERGTNGTVWNAVATVGVDVTSYRDTGLSPGTTYAYRTIAINAAGASAPSNTATATTPAAPVNRTFVAAGSTWKYFDNGSDQGTAWRATGFDDAAWRSGPAQLGYGDGDEATAINSGGASRFITSYFRRAFDVADPAAVTALTLRLLRDDGAVVYLNGSEIVRSNMPAGTVTYTTGASTFLGAPQENAWHTFMLSPAALVPGRNVLAVEVHQYDSVSTDLSFDLELTGTVSGSTGTTVAPSAPSNFAATSVSSSRIDLSWADNSDNESGFRVERSTDGTTWSSLATTAPGTNSYSDTGLTASTTYHYRLYAFNSAGDSASSNTNSATTGASSPTDDVVYSGPLVITRGGTYSGNWQSLDPAVPAVTIATSEPVIILNANLRGRGALIKSSRDHADLTVRNTRGYALNPNVYGQTPGRFLEAERFDNIVVENNYLEGTSGIKLLDYLGDRTTADTVRIVGNSALNIDGRKSDGAGGYLNFNERRRISDGVVEQGYKIRQFVQLDKVQNVPGIEIAWNQVVNEPGRSRVEDNINIYMSGGTSGSPIRIHDNYIHGAYTVRPSQGGTTSDGTWEYDWGYAGGGILLGDGRSGVAYVQAYDNQVVATTNYGIAIAAGHDSSFYRNRVLSGGRLADGRFIAEQNVGAYIWDLYGAGSGSFYNNSGRDNLIGWVNNPAGGRNDWWIPDAASFENNTRWPGEITLQTEAEESARWRSKVAAAGITVGTFPSSNQAPTVSAGSDIALTLPSSAALDGTVTDDGQPNPPGAVTTLWTLVSGPGTVTFADAAATDTTASFSAAGTYVLRLTADDGGVSTSDDITITVEVAPPANVAPSVNAGTDLSVDLPSSVALDATVTDDGLPNPPGTVTTLWALLSGPGSVTFTDASAVDTTASFSAAGTYVLRLTADDGAVSVSDEVTVVVEPANQAPTVSAGPDQTIAAPESALLDGTAIDDATTPGALTTLWTLVSGPGTVTFADAGAVDTTASFSTSGTYVLRLTADDGALSASDDVTVHVAPRPNQAPSVSAGPDLSVALPAPAALDGTVTDDGQPNPPGAATTLWTVVSGPGTVTFGDAAAVDTTAAFSTPGTYVLRLSADDGSLSTSDDMTVEVAPPPNDAPSVSAGPDLSIVLPSSAFLDGAVTDDGLPNPSGAVTALWVMVSGPGTVTFDDASAVDTTASFSAAGTYVLRLTADDGSLSARDDVTIEVSPPNQAPSVSAGLDLTVSIKASVVLDGTVSDDGLPRPPGSLRTLWTVVRGPGTVAFADAAAVDTNAIFSAAGTYVLRLTAQDGELSASDEITVVCLAL